ncbi:glycoside hydrolase family 2 [Haloterrigena alkaliphila]|uniref:Glycoside hydrolase family 2 n=1 Tax=Haloterrigena alkaliphila TaxID=2816475 RepID=A0A8A2VCJ3_9EURY|nr:glycoside hydrolase family 2 [Haloterrigena alkaliphila]QSW98427.1 glycoside hydrolase family 2 [Haloterrigena alkaliphila]
MDANWTGGVVDRSDDGPPTDDEWRPVAESGRWTEAADPADRIAYRTTFGDPRTSDDERGFLKLHGAGPRAELWLNGDRVRTREGSFGPVRAAFDPRPENELIVVRERPGSAARDEATADPSTDPSSAGGTAVTDVAGVDLDVSSVGLNLDVEGRPQTFCRRLEARPRLTDDGGVVDIEMEVDAGRAVDDAITLSVRPEGFRGGATMQRLSVEAAAGERVTVTESIEIREPALWWPTGYGPRHRYAVQAKLGGDSTETTAAFRTVDRDGDDLLVNGTPVRSRGFVRRSGGPPVVDVERAVAANANLLRVRGHVPSESFYAACDAAGVLVWQDLPSTGIGGDPAADRVRDLAAALEDAYGHHPSLALYGVADESAASGAADGLYGSGIMTKLRFRYRTWRTDVDGEATDAAAEAVPGDRPVVSSVGPPGTDPDAAALYPGWRYLAADDIEWLLERDPDLARIVAAFGAGSLTESGVNPADVSGLDGAVLERRLGDDVGVDASQTYQARTLKVVAEALRRRQSALLSASTLRDTDAAGGTGVLTVDGDAKPAYRAIADAFEPVQAVLDGPPAPGRVGITLCNDTHESLEATVAWTAGDATGETVVRVGPLSTAAAGTADVPAAASRIELTVDAGDRTISNEYRL